MKRFLKFRYGQGGFTLIELLIVVAILGILAAVIIPNVGGLMGTATVNAANTEVTNVKTAAIAYLADNDGSYSGINEIGALDPYLSGTLKADYTFDDDAGSPTYGLITEGKAHEGEYVGLTFYKDTQMWEKTHTTNP